MRLAGGTVNTTAERTHQVGKVCDACIVWQVSRAHSALVLCSDLCWQQLCAVSPFVRFFAYGPVATGI